MGIEQEIGARGDTPGSGNMKQRVTTTPSINSMSIFR